MKIMEPKLKEPKVSLNLLQLDRNFENFSWDSIDNGNQNNSTQKEEAHTKVAPHVSKRSTTN